MADALKVGGGTLAVSWLNLGEYVTVTSRETRLQAERLLDRIVPAVFPLDVDAAAVSKRELAGRIDPHADLGVATLFVRSRPSIAASGLDLRITASGMFEPLNDDRLIRSKHRLAAMTRDSLEKLLRRHADDPRFQRGRGASGAFRGHPMGLRRILDGVRSDFRVFDPLRGGPH